MSLLAATSRVTQKHSFVLNPISPQHVETKQESYLKGMSVNRNLAKRWQCYM